MIGISMLAWKVVCGEEICSVDMDENALIALPSGTVKPACAILIDSGRKEQETTLRMSTFDHWAFYFDQEKIGEGCVKTIRGVP